MRVVVVCGEVNISKGRIWVGGWKMRKEAPHRVEEIVALPFRLLQTELSQRTWT